MPKPSTIRPKFIECDQDGDYCTNEFCRKYAGPECCYMSGKMVYLSTGGQMAYPGKEIRKNCRWLKKNKQIENQPQNHIALLGGTKLLQLNG